MRITIIGSGYVGLVTGTCLAEMGNHVCCFDVDSRKIERLRRGDVPIYEPGLSEMLRRNVAAERLTFTADNEEAIAFGDIQFIAVGTPPDEDGSADIQYVLAAARAIGRSMTQYKIVVDKSTVPVGTADKVQAVLTEELARRGVDIPFSVVSNPEFLKEGAALDDFMKPDRIVVGCEDERAMHSMRRLYSPFQRNHDRLLFMDVRSAELTKYAANAMLATRISFMNELANLAETLGADIELVRRGIGADPRIGYHFLYPGTGYGGSCFPKDVAALIHTGKQHGHTLRVLEAVEAANHVQKYRLVDKVVARFGSDLTGRRFALWGLAFKPNTDDMREAPSLIIIEQLTQRGADVVAFDPIAMDEARRVVGEHPRLHFAHDMMHALHEADALLIVTEWKTFRSPNFDRVRQLLKEPVIFDGRNLYEPTWLREQGFDYYAMGR